MRLLVYGMMSSGASAFTLVLAQRPGCLALVDVINNYAAPRIDTTLDMVVKVKITTAYPLAVHVERFRPDRVILLLRDPRDNYASLATKSYRNHSGLIDEKFLIADQVFAERQCFDAVIAYEDFIARDPSVAEKLEALGWPVEESYRSYGRRHDDLIGDLIRHVPDLLERMEIAFGNVRGKAVQAMVRDQPHDPAMVARLETLCPRLLAYYRARQSHRHGSTG